MTAERRRPTRSRKASGKKKSPRPAPAKHRAPKARKPATAKPVVLRAVPPRDDQESPNALKPGARRKVAILAIRQTVLFPYALLPLGVGRPRSVKLIHDCMAGDRTLAVIAQRDAQNEMPGFEDLHDVGTLATVLRMIPSAENQLSVLVQGISRVRVTKPLAVDPFLRAEIEMLGDIETAGVAIDGLVQAVLEQFQRVVALSPTIPDEAATAARQQEGSGRTGDFIASVLDLTIEDKQRLLGTLDVAERLAALSQILEHQLQVLEVGKQIQESVRESIDEHQREFLLRQQMEAIRKELGEGDESGRELEELKEKIEKAGMPPEVQKEADREFARLGRIPPQAAEYTVARTYLEWLCDMPWAVTTEDQLDLAHVRKILDEDHYGLDKIKERILEYLAVRRFKSDARTPMLCFAGPPGTGKTSLGRSIARAVGRKFVRQSLGGVRDEAEIRGHRRTYIGALPGNIIRGLRRAGSRNPLFMLDEVDKLGADFRGDPSAALLEVLDPEQNHAFVDHYLDVPFDLSQIMFLLTANYLDPVPPALRDRMEVIELSGYVDREKLEIAKRHLLPKIVSENGLDSLGITVTDEAVLRVVHEYTREAGLRNLERELANLLRRTAKEVAEGKTPLLAIGPERVRELLGPPQFDEDRAALLDAPGAALGLAWTPAGGEVLTIEATSMPGGRGLMLTGQLGEVMKESAQAGLSYIRSHAAKLGIDPGFFEGTDLHVHVPAGAIPKDGPSAGVALCTAMVSLLTGRKARPGIAMTGEITLRGMVLRVGGIKEKVLGAHRGGLNTVILPTHNQGDLEEVPVEVRSRMIFAPVDRIEQALELALEAPSKGKRAANGGVRRDDERTTPPAETERPALAQRTAPARRRA